MKKLFGIRGDLKNFPFPEFKETIYGENGIEIEISDNALEVGVDDESLLEEAKEIALIALANWNRRQNTKASVTFNSSWSRDSSGKKSVSQYLAGEIKPHGRRRLVATTWQHHITGKSFIITQKTIDTVSFTNEAEVVKKALKYPALKAALLHFSDEVADSDRPLYGIYKSLEAITKELKKQSGKDGREQLASLAAQPKEYVADVMETAQTVRHSPSAAPGNPKAKLTEDQCRLRARLLIKAYADSLTA